MKRRNFIREASLGSLALTGIHNTLVGTTNLADNTTSADSDSVSDSGSKSLFKNLQGFQPLKVEKTESEITVKGGTFNYTICKVTGLMTSARILGDEWLTGHMPDLWASTANDPRTMQYYARYTPSIKAGIREYSPYRVVISSAGSFATINNTPLPLDFNLLYTFDIDGTVKVDVEVSAEKDIIIRWLTLVEGSISQVCQFVSYEYDLGNGPRTCSPSNYDVSEEINIGGKYIPWFHFGNDKGGLELIFPHSDKRHASYTDSSPFPGGDPFGRAYDLFVLKNENKRLTCTSFAVRNHREVIGPNASFKDSFYISAMPGRKVRPETNSMQVQWTGPHQYRNNWKHPGENDIQKWAAGGVNYIVGGANWYSGDYSNCSMPEKTMQFLDTCHKYGLKVIPYITFTDQEYPTPGFNTTGPKWRIEPVVEFNYRSQLMCYGAEEWQEHWRNEISRIFDQFPFDGLYIDFWAGKMNCFNAQHGCVGPYGRFTVEGLRMMARTAREIVDTKTDNGLILSNTNILPLAMINNWMDARLYGEWHNLEETDPLSLRIYYNSHRYGTGNVLLVSKVPEITEKTLALSALFQGNPVISHARTPEGRKLLERNALLLNAFGANKSVALNQFEMGELNLSADLADRTGTSIYYNPENENLLICLSTFKQPASTVRLGSVLNAVLQKASTLLDLQNYNSKHPSFYYYVFEDKNLIGAKALTMNELDMHKLEIPSENYRNIWIKPSKHQPTVLYALSNGDKVEENFNPENNELLVTIYSKARNAAETVVLGPNPKAVTAADKKVPFNTNDGWWTGDFPCNKQVVVKY